MCYRFQHVWRGRQSSNPGGIGKLLLPVVVVAVIFNVLCFDHGFVSPTRCFARSVTFLQNTFHYLISLSSQRRCGSIKSCPSVSIFVLWVPIFPNRRLKLCSYHGYVHAFSPTFVYFDVPNADNAYKIGVIGPVFADTIGCVCCIFRACLSIDALS